MLHLLRRISIGALALSALLLSSVPAAHAADQPDGDTTWMVRPSDGTGEDGRSWIELELDPGESVEEHLLVRNLSASAVTFQLSAADGYFTDNGRFNMLTSDMESVDAGTWITIQETVEVPSGSDVIVPFTITVPENATPGDHPAGVAAGIRSGGDDEVGIESRVGFRVMSRVTGELAPSLTADSSGSYLGSWNPFDPGRLDLDYTVENSGNTRLSVAPQVTVTALFGMVSFTTSAEPITEIAPGESRSGTVSFPGVWPLFVYSGTVVADVTAVTNELDPGAIAPVELSTPILAVPWSQLVALAVALLLLWFLWRDRRRRDRLIEARIERARQEERDAVVQTAESPVHRTAFAAVVVAIISLTFAAGGATPAAATPMPDDSHGITLQVQIDEKLVSTTPPTSPPSEGVGGGSLPRTGAPDLGPLALGGLAAIGMGIGIHVVRTRRQAAR